MSDPPITKYRPDEVFVARDIGVVIDVAGLIDHVNASPAAFPITTKSTAWLLACRRGAVLTPNHVRDMVPRRRDEPILLASIGGAWWVVDGNHRLARRHDDGLVETACVLVSNETIESFAAVLDW